MPTERLQYLIERYFDKTINDSQLIELTKLVTNQASDQDLIKLLEQAWDEHRGYTKMPDKISDKIISAILNASPSQNSKATSHKVISIHNRVWWLKRFAVAASIVIIFFSVRYFTIKSSVSPTATDSVAKTAEKDDIKPGGQKAKLILSDGSVIILDSANNGLLAKQGTTKVIKLANGQLQYIPNSTASSEIVYNTMSTPVGGQYQLMLPDGSKVWLNSSSSIRYPATFAEKERRVEITGEAYFEIAKETNRPFKVKINLQTGEGGEVEVLGTHFNINAYEDESIVRTTLYEGSVKVNTSAGANQIRPGQQLQSGKSGQIRIVDDANLEEVIAWKEGRFQFENTDINTVMRQLARWYDIDVEFKENITSHLGGTISRNVNISKVLEMLALTGVVNFKVQGKKVIVL